MKEQSWQRAKFIDGPKKGEFVWVLLEDGRPFFAPHTTALVPQMGRVVAINYHCALVPQMGRVVAINYHCATHYPGRLHGTRLEWLEMLPKGSTSVEMEDVCLGDIEHVMFGIARDNEKAKL